MITKVLSSVFIFFFIFSKKRFTNAEKMYIFADIGEDEQMGISYKPLWRLLLEKNMNKTELMKAIGLSPPTLAKLSKNEPVDGKVLERICVYFKCQPADVIEYLHDEE